MSDLLGLQIAARKGQGFKYLARGGGSTFRGQRRRLPHSDLPTARSESCSENVTKRNSCAGKQPNACMKANRRWGRKLGTKRG